MRAEKAGADTFTARMPKNEVGKVRAGKKGAKHVAYWEGND